MSMTFVKAEDPQRVVAALAAYYAAAERPGPAEVVADFKRKCLWEYGFEPEPDEPLKLFVSQARVRVDCDAQERAGFDVLPSQSWIAVAFPGLTFDLPFTAWLATHLKTETVAAYSWDDGYGLVRFDTNGVVFAESHIRDERSDMHLEQELRDIGVPFDGVEYRHAVWVEDRRIWIAAPFSGIPGWLGVAVPPRPWPPIPSGELPRPWPPIPCSKLPELSLEDALNIFRPGWVKGLMRISEHCPLAGELYNDMTGSCFLAPEKDYRGTGMQSIEVHGLDEAAKRLFFNRAIHVTGIFTESKGLLVETIKTIEIDGTQPNEWVRPRESYERIE